VGVSWGYREVEELWMHGAAMVVSDPAEIATLVLGNAGPDPAATPS
jgi:phosphoglycolate phosphatase-like HAD superfamily hydrolase